VVSWELSVEPASGSAGRGGHAAGAKHSSAGGGLDAHDFPLVFHLGGNARSAPLGGLEANQTYVVRARARNSAGWGGWSLNLEARSAAALPPKVPSTMVVDAGRFSDVLRARWTPAEERGSPVQGYEVWLRPEGGDGRVAGGDGADSANTTGAVWKQACQVGADVHECFAEGLAAGSAYAVRMRASSRAGWSAWTSGALVGRTHDEAACATRADQGVLGQGTSFQAQLKSCAKGCWADLGCTRDCLSKADVGLSRACASCHGHLALCTKDSCMRDCMFNSDGEPCARCAADHCRPAFVACAGIAEELLAGSSSPPPRR